MNNQELEKIFLEISTYLGMEDDPFRPKAYIKAANVIASLDRDIGSIFEEGGLEALEALPGIGKAIALKIKEYLETGKLDYLSRLKAEIDIDLPSLMKVEGLGPKRIKALYKNLGVKNLTDLEQALLDHKVRELDGFSDKLEQSLLESVNFAKTAKGRFVLGFIYDDILQIVEKIKALDGVSKVEIAGSARRMKETIGDIDILAVMKKGSESLTEKVMDYFVSMPQVVHIYAKGDTKSSVRLAIGIDVDLRILEGESYGAGMLYFTGSKEHNIEIRKIAIKQGLKLNEYGLFKEENDKLIKIVSEREEDIYKMLGLQFVPPELREDLATILELGKSPLPALIGYNDLKGDLQLQTNWSDGDCSIEEYAIWAISMGYQYILITDHSKRLTVANGLNRERLLLQAKEIDLLNQKFKKEGVDFRILKGVECDILEDGSLDLDDDVLRSLDLVGASVHSYFNLPIAKQTDRLLKAMENSNVDIIFHLTARKINERPEIQLDISKIIDQAKETGTALEIDSFPDRLDINTDIVKSCLQKGVKMTIDSDAHSLKHMSYTRFGIATARRGGVTKEDIANTRSVDECLKLLQKS